MRKMNLPACLFLALIASILNPHSVTAASLNIIYRGDDIVDMYINNDIVQEWKKFQLTRDVTLIETWEIQTDADVYYSDTIASFSSHTYTLSSYWGTNGVAWVAAGTDVAAADASTMKGTIHNSTEWQILLGRSAVVWENQTDDYEVEIVIVADGYLGIYNCTVKLNNSAYYLEAIHPGTIAAEGSTFTSSTSVGASVRFVDQSDPFTEVIDDCSFQNVDLALENSTGVVIRNSSFSEGEVSTDSTSSGNTFYNCSGNFDMSISGDENTVRDCPRIRELTTNGTNHDILRNTVRNIEARGNSGTIRDNTFTSETYAWIRLDIYGDSIQVLENTLEHRTADNSYMIRIIGDSNTVEENVVTEYVAGAGTWSNGLYIQGGSNNTVQLNRITGHISGGSMGILLDDGATGNLVKKNTVKNCQNGIWVGWPSAADGNNFENNAISSAGRAAFDVENSSNNVFAYNHIWDSSTGFYVSGDGNGIHENIIEDCTSQGVLLYGAATNSWVYNNVFRNNTVHAIDDGTGNRWNKPKTLLTPGHNIVGGPYLGGNYWDTYTGTDPDGDKLGSPPQQISGLASSSDGLPLIYVSMPSPTPGPTPEGLGTIVSGDYNGDGTDDLGIFRGSSSLWAIRGVSRTYFGIDGDYPVSGDYNGDGSADIAVFRSSAGLWAIKGVSRMYFGATSDVPVSGDYNGDGTCDTGIFRDNAGLWAIRGVTRVYFGTAGDSAVPGDYSGDGSADIGLYRSSAGLWALRGVSRLYFGGSSDIPVPGDYNAAGRRAPAIFRPSAGLWALRGVSRVYFGATGDRAVPADFNGDGADDIGIFRETAGLWAIRGISRAYFGTNGDVPVTR